MDVMVMNNQIQNSKPMGHEELNKALVSMWDSLGICHGFAVSCRA